jgi:hypothetical protein
VPRLPDPQVNEPAGGGQRHTRGSPPTHSAADALLCWPPPAKAYAASIASPGRHLRGDALTRSSPVHRRPPPQADSLNRRLITRQQGSTRCSPVCPAHLPEPGGSRVHSRSRRRSSRLRAIYPGGAQKAQQRTVGRSGGTFTLREASRADCAAYQNPPGCPFDCAVASRLWKRDTPHPGEQKSSRPGPTSPDDSPFETLLVFPPQH